MNMAIQPLRELAQEIFVGIPIPRGEKAEEGAVAYPVINVRDIVDGRVAPFVTLDSVHFSARSAVDRYRVCEGDVLLTSRGTQLKVAPGRYGSDWSGGNFELAGHSPWGSIPPVHSCMHICVARLPRDCS